jgi:N-acetylglucosamine-6-phosphate deacetylase
VIITARTLITAIGTVAYPAITVDASGLIIDISSDGSIQSDRILTPTFFDIHIHGGAGYDLMDADPAAMSRMQRFLAAQGTSHYLATTVTATIDQTLAALDRLGRWIDTCVPPGEAQLLGVHLEGPFLSHAKRGVHPAELLQPPSIALFERFQQAALGHIRLLTIAPETPGALDLIRYAAGQGVRVSLGHSNATAAETLAAIEAGATSATHTFNAMRPLDHREPGIAGTVLDQEWLYAELICDGIHVDPALVRLWMRLKGERAILVTDGISATGMSDGRYSLGSLAVTVEAGRCSLTDAPGTLAGSVLTLDRAVENLMRFTGCTLETAVRAASSQPARMLGKADSIASLRKGQPASFNCYTPEGRLEATYLRGQKLPTR